MIKNKKVLLFVFLSALLLCSCDNEQQPEDTHTSRTLTVPETTTTAEPVYTGTAEHLVATTTTDYEEALFDIQADTGDTNSVTMDNQAINKETAIPTNDITVNSAVTADKNYYEIINSDTFDLNQDIDSGVVVQDSFAVATTEITVTCDEKSDTSDKNYIDFNNY